MKPDLNTELENFLRKDGADFICFANIRQLPAAQSRGYFSAVLFGIALSAPYLRKVAETPDYVAEMIRGHEIDKDEFHRKEILTDRLADSAALFLSGKGYTAFSQSEANLLKYGLYDGRKKATPLPHKTIAVLAGLGWIGKNNLLITPDFGCALSMCAVLTDAPVTASSFGLKVSLCGGCMICSEACQRRALKGAEWNKMLSRKDLIDTDKCNSCLKCMVLCPHTIAFANHAQ